MAVALIAGEGSLPEIIAERLFKGGERPLVYALRERLDAFEPFADDVVPVFKTELAATLKDMSVRGVKKIYFAGVVPKTLMYRAAMQDAMARDFVESLSVRDDHTLLGGIVSIFEKSGFQVVGYRDLLGDLISTMGQIAGRAPTEAERSDVAYGVEIARAVVPLSFGQSVIVHKKSVVAVEAMEGTDATVVRAGSICKSGVLVKMIKPGQDERYDIPTVGAQTLKLMASAGLSCLALQAGWTLVLDRDVFQTLADELGIAVIGVDF